jgi:hypothetical protein
LRIVLGLLAVVAYGAEADAVAISSQIQTRHLPFGTILDPFYVSSTSDQITGYTRCGDSALWTGHYLAAEAYRYRVTGSAEALNNARGAVAGLQSLVDVTCWPAAGFHPRRRLRPESGAKRRRMASTQRVPITGSATPPVINTAAQFTAWVPHIR